MKGGYESMVWLNDRNGKEFVCYLDDIKGDTKNRILTDEEKRRCFDVNQLIGTERW